MKNTDVVNGETGIMTTSDGSEIRVGSSAWFDRVDNWNGTPDRFFYQLDEMVYTANTQRRRNKNYWYAFRQLDGRRINHYLCSVCYDLTLDRLADAAKWLHAKMNGVEPDGDTLLQWRCRKCGQRFFGTVSDLPTRCASSQCRGDVTTWYPVRNSDTTFSPDAASSERVEPVELPAPPVELINSDTTDEPAADPLDDQTPDASATADGVQPEPMHDLNERQLFYLQEIYKLDQEQELMQRLMYARLHDRTPAKIWRRVWYDNEPGTGSWRTELYSRLHAAGYVDPGTGSTFKALAERGLIDRHWSRYDDGTDALAVTITRAGRALVRSIAGTDAPKKRPAGQLKIKQWEALAAVYSVYPDAIWKKFSVDYGGFSWEWTWLRLRDYPEKFGGALVRETTKHESIKHENAFPTTRTTYGIKITDAGRRFYEMHYDEYKALYPDVVAPSPDHQE